VVVTVSAYAIVNLMDVESSAPAGSGIEGRFGRKHLDSEHLGVSYFRYSPGLRASRAHSHRSQEEAYVVVSGSGRMLVGDDVIELKRWDVIRVAPSTVRAFEAGEEGLELIAVGADRPEGGDGVAADATWPEG
jgi:mannose-6-phosphate isomerase-like protein (cupin superfamily)